MLEMIGIISQRYAKPGAVCYDLGCSLGAATLAMAESIAHQETKIIAVDNSPAMIERCKDLLNNQSNPTQIELRLEDVLDTDIENASLVVMNFTLQFIPKAERNALLKRIYDGLNSGGVLILSEKICEQNAQANSQLIDLYHDFKASRGYSRLEIAQKREALENVLIPESIAEHQHRITAAGFASALPWFKCFNFTSLIATK